MSSIILPRKWNTQPQYPVEPNWNLPELAGVEVVAAAFGASNSAFTKSGSRFLTRVASPTTIITPLGISLSGDGSADTSTPDRWQYQSALLNSVVSLFVPTNVTDSSRGIAFLHSSTTDTTLGTTGQLGIAQNGADIQWVTRRAVRVTSTGVLTAGSPIALGLDYTGSGNYYINGVFQGFYSNTIAAPVCLDIAGGSSGSSLGGCVVTLSGAYASGFRSERLTRLLQSSPFEIFRKQTQVLYFDVGGAGAQTLTPSLYVDGDTFHAATVSAGAVTLTPSLYSDGDTFHAATVTLGGAAQDLTPSLFADGDTFHSATVAAGSVNLAPSLVTDADTFHSATVAPGSVTLTPSLVTDGDTFYTHAVVLEGGPQTLSPDLFADGDTFHAATVTPGTVTLTPSLYTDPDTFHAAEVASGFNLQPPAYADPDTFYPATVAVGAVSLTPDLYVDGDAFHAPTVSLAGTQTLTPDLFADADTFYVPTLTGGTVILGAARSAGRQIQSGARSNIQTNRR